MGETQNLCFFQSADAFVSHKWRLLSSNVMQGYLSVQIRDSRPYNWHQGGDMAALTWASLGDSLPSSVLLSWERRLTWSYMCRSEPMLVINVQKWALVMNEKTNAQVNMIIENQVYRPLMLFDSHLCESLCRLLCPFHIRESMPSFCSIKWETWRHSVQQTSRNQFLQMSATKHRQRQNIPKQVIIAVCATQIKLFTFETLHLNHSHHQWSLLILRVTRILISSWAKVARIFIIDVIRSNVVVTMRSDKVCSWCL